MRSIEQLKERDKWRDKLRKLNPFTGRGQNKKRTRLKD